MKLKSQKAADIKRMLPLLRSIATEIRERMIAADRLESRLAAHGRAHRRHPVNAEELRARLGVHKHELKRAADELRRLGWKILRADTTRILLVGTSFLLDVGWEADAAAARSSSAGAAR